MPTSETPELPTRAFVTLRNTVQEGELTRLEPNSKGSQSLHGWIRWTWPSYRAAQVEIRIDDAPAFTARAERRLDRWSLSSRLGFRVDLPPNLAAGETIKISLHARAGSQSVLLDRKAFRRAPIGERLGGSSVAIPLQPAAQSSREPPLSSAAVILTRDGSPLLSALLASIVTWEPQGFRRIIVVDHGSTDDTGAVIRRFAATLPVECLSRPRSNSFSQSNNEAAALCDEDVLFFLNNDIVLTEAIVDCMVAHLTPEAGMVGLRLMDPSQGGQIPAQQHVGVHVAPTASSPFPFETRRLTDGGDADRLAIHVPSVTAALAAMRRSLFLELGGFDESYFFGWEDTDLALRARAAGRRNVCVNSISACHIGAYTRRRLSPTVKERLKRNESIFRERWAYPLRRACSGGDLDITGFWTGRVPAIGVVTAGNDAWAWEAGSGAAGASFFRFHTAEPVDALGLDALLILDAAFNLTTTRNLSSIAWLVAIAHGDPGAWAGATWREQVDLWLAESSAEAKTLAQLLGRQVSVVGDGRATAAAVEVLRERACRGFRISLVAASQQDEHDTTLALRLELEKLGHSVRLQKAGALSSLPLRDDALVWLPPGDIARQEPGLLQVLAEDDWAAACRRDAASFARELDGRIRAADAEWPSLG